MKQQWTSKELHDQDLEVWFRDSPKRSFGLIPFPLAVDLASQRLEYVIVKVPPLRALEPTKVDPYELPALTAETELDTKMMAVQGEIIICKSNKEVIAATDPTLCQSGPSSTLKKI